MKTDDKVYMRLNLLVKCHSHGQQLMLAVPDVEFPNEIVVMVKACSQCIDQAVRLALEMKRNG